MTEAWNAPDIHPPLSGLPKAQQRDYAHNGYIRFNRGTGELYMIDEPPPQAPQDISP
ncbi:MAG: hypothetical protein AAFO06_04585 [Cyanobacteria bacterium J06597_16]